MERLRTLLEISSNFSIIVVAVLLVGFAATRYSSPSVSPPAKVEVVKPGSIMPTTDLVWDKSGKNLVMALSTRCKYCDESVALYQKLSANRHARGVRLIAVLPQPKDESSKYLADRQITVDEIVQLNPGQIGVRGTPTLLLVNESGLILEAWRGKLPAEKEVEVLTRIFEGTL